MASDTHFSTHIYIYIYIETDTLICECSETRRHIRARKRCDHCFGLLDKQIFSGLNKKQEVLYARRDVSGDKSLSPRRCVHRMGYIRNIYTHVRNDEIYWGPCKIYSIIVTPVRTQRARQKRHTSLGLLLERGTGRTNQRKSYIYSFFAKSGVSSHPHTVRVI